MIALALARGGGGKRRGYGLREGGTRGGAVAREKTAGRGGGDGEEWGRKRETSPQDQHVCSSVKASFAKHGSAQFLYRQSDGLEK